jgi:hypothetical protein
MNPQQQDSQQAQPQTAQEQSLSAQPQHSLPQQPQVIMPDTDSPSPSASDRVQAQRTDQPDFQQPQPALAPQPQVETPQAGEQINPLVQPQHNQSPVAPMPPVQSGGQPSVDPQPQQQPSAEPHIPDTALVQAPQQGLQAPATEDIIHQSDLVWIGKTNFSVKQARLSWYKDGDIGLQVIDEKSKQPTESVFKLNPKQITKIKAPSFMPGVLEIRTSSAKYNLNFAHSAVVRILGAGILSLLGRFLMPIADPNVKERKWWVENLKAHTSSKS